MRTWKATHGHIEPALPPSASCRSTTVARHDANMSPTEYILDALGHKVCNRLQYCNHLLQVGWALQQEWRRIKIKGDGPSHNR